MSDNTMPQDFSHLQDVFGNVPMVKRYTLLCLFFELSEPIVMDQIETVLRKGLNTLSSCITHLKGHVIFEGQTEGNWGKAKIFPLEDRIKLSVKDIRTDASFPRMTEMRRARFPFSMLEEKVLIPHEHLPLSYTDAGPYKESAERPARVLVLQATIIRGGVILTFTSNHTTMDMNGLGQMICLFAKACREEPFTAKEIENANQSRRNAVPLLGDEYKPGPEQKYFTFQPPVISSQPNGPESVPLWAYVNISADSVRRLKQKASEQRIVSYITTNDALSAFFWQRILKARSARLGRGIESEMNRQLSARRLLGLGDGYMGHMTGSAHNHEIDVWEQPLGTVAGKLRQTLQDTDLLRFHVRAMATMLERVPDKTKIGYGASLNWERDVVLSSYAEIQCCQVSFGPLLGTALAARRPRAIASPSLVYLMPKDGSGDMAAAVCLREDDMIRMREDSEFIEYAEYLG